MRVCVVVRRSNIGINDGERRHTRGSSLRVCERESKTQQQRQRDCEDLLSYKVICRIFLQLK